MIWKRDARAPRFQNERTLEDELQSELHFPRILRRVQESELTVVDLGVRILRSEAVGHIVCLSSGFQPLSFLDLERAEAGGFYRQVGSLGRLFLEIETEAFMLPAMG